MPPQVPPEAVTIIQSQASDALSANSAPAPDSAPHPNPKPAAKGAKKGKKKTVPWGRHASHKEGEFRVFVSGLPVQTAQSDLANLFRPFGKLLEVFVLRRLHPTAGTRSAFVRFAHESAGRAAIQALHSSIWKGQKLCVCESKHNEGGDAPIPTPAVAAAKTPAFGPNAHRASPWAGSINSDRMMTSMALSDTEELSLPFVPNAAHCPTREYSNGLDGRSGSYGSSESSDSLTPPASVWGEVEAFEPTSAVPQFQAAPLRGARLAYQPERAHREDAKAAALAALAAVASSNEWRSAPPRATYAWDTGIWGGIWGQEQLRQPPAAASAFIDPTSSAGVKAMDASQWSVRHEEVPQQQFSAAAIAQAVAVVASLIAQAQSV